MNWLNSQYQIMLMHTLEEKFKSDKFFLPTVKLLTLWQVIVCPYLLLPLLHPCFGYYAVFSTLLYNIGHRRIGI